MYAYICYFLLDVRANRSDRAWVPWSIDSFEKYTIFVYFTCKYHLMYADISYFLLDVRAKQSSRAWVPWSIDSFEKYSTFVYFTRIISSHIRIYRLFSFGCSGESVRPCVSSLQYRFLWKIHYLRVLYMQCHLMFADISYFLLEVRANRSDRAWVPCSIDSFEKYSYHSCTLHA